MIMKGSTEPILKERSNMMTDSEYNGCEDVARKLLHEGLTQLLLWSSQQQA